METQRAKEIEAFNLRKKTKKDGKFTMSATQAAQSVGLDSNPPEGWTVRGDGKSIKRRSAITEYSKNAKQQTDGKNTWPDLAGPGFERHHKRMVSLYAKLYEDLSNEDAKKLSAYATVIGIPLGNVNENAEILSVDVHEKIHAWMRENGMSPKDLPDFSKQPLSTRMDILEVLYKDYMQPAIDKELENIKKQKIDTPENALASIQEQFNRSNSFKKGLNLAARAARNAVPVAGTVMDAVDTGRRIDDFMEDPTLINAAQVATGVTSTAANAVGDVFLAGGVTAPGNAITEVVATGVIPVDIALQSLEDHIANSSDEDMEMQKEKPKEEVDISKLSKRQQQRYRARLREEAKRASK